MNSFQTETTAASRDVSQFVTDLLQQAGVSTEDPNELARLRYQLENLDAIDVRSELSQQDNQLELIQKLQLENQKLKRRIGELEQQQQQDVTEHLPGCNMYVDKAELTRHLIKRDKQWHKHNAGAQQILNEIQERLGLDINTLHDGLDDIKGAIEKIPSMKKFIQEVQQAVGAERKSLDETISLVRRKVKQ